MLPNHPFMRNVRYVAPKSMMAIHITTLKITNTVKPAFQALTERQKSIKKKKQNAKLLWRAVTAPNVGKAFC